MNELATFAVANQAIVPLLWALLALAIVLVGTFVLLLLQRLKLAAFKKREALLARHIVTKSDEIARLEEKVTQYTEMEDGVDDLKAEVRRVDAIRGKTEDRLVAQNAELEQARADLAARTAELAAQAAELARLRKVVQHIDVL